MPLIHVAHLFHSLTTQMHSIPYITNLIQRAMWAVERLRKIIWKLVSLSIVKMIAKHTYDDGSLHQQDRALALLVGFCVAEVYFLFSSFRSVFKVGNGGLVHHTLLAPRAV